MTVDPLQSASGGTVEAGSTHRDAAIQTLVALAGFALIAAVFANRAVGYPGAYEPDRFQGVPDAVADWMTTKAAFDGTGAYRPITELGSNYAVPVPDYPDTAVHPRLPGAFLLMSPLLVASPESSVAAGTTVSLLAIAGLLWTVWRHERRPWIPYLGLGLVLAPPFLELVAHGSHIGLVALLVAGSWYLASQREVLSGVLLGVTSVLRAFPLLLIPALWVAGRRRAAVSAVLTFLGINIGGLFLSGVEFGQTVDGLSASTAVFGSDVHNGSVYGLLTRIGLEGRWWALMALVATLLVWIAPAVRTRRLDQLIQASIPLAILASPLAWPTYQLCLIPVIARERGRRLWAIAGAFILGYLAWYAFGVGVSGLAMAATTTLVLASAVRSSNGVAGSSSLRRI